MLSLEERLAVLSPHLHDAMPLTVAGRAGGFDAYGAAVAGHAWPARRPGSRAGERPLRIR